MARHADHQRRFESLEDRRLFSVPAVLGGTDRVSLDLSSNWKFIRQDVTNAQLASTSTKNWSTVNLPNTYNAVDGADGGSNGNPDYYQGGTWYRKDFTISSKFNGRRVYLGVGAASIKADVYVNGNYAGSHTGAYEAFNIDVTGYLLKGVTNTVAIRVDNTQDSNVPGYIGDFTNFGGLTRGVTLFATSKLAINPTDSGSSGVKITQSAVTSTHASLNVDVSVRNSDKKNAPYTLITSIVDAAGRVVKKVSNTFSALARKARTFTQQITLTNPHLWNGTADPYLYTAYTQISQAGVIYDTVPTTIGIRSVVMSGGVLKLNGKTLQLKGVDLHDDKQGVGTAMTDADRARDVKLLLEMGANAVRFAHWEVDPDFYDQMDRAGILVWTEIPLWRHATAGSTFLDNAKQEMQELIRQNINHPSIFTWGLFNELPDTSLARSIVQAVNDEAHAEDPTRFTIAASDLSASAGINSIPDVVTYNQYFGWYNDYDQPAATRINQLTGFLNDQATLKPGAPLGIGEYGAGANIAQHIDDPASGAPSGDPALSQDHPEEYQAYLHELSWNVIKNSTTPVFGSFIWELTDNANDDRSEGDLPGLNDKGLVTYDGKTPKDAFYYYKSQWSTAPVLYLTSKRFTTRTDTTANVKAYTNLGQDVQLIVNGHSISSKTAADGVVTWDDVPLNVGDNAVQIRSVKDGKTYTDSTTWTRAGILHAESAAFAVAISTSSEPKHKDDDEGPEALT